MDITARTKVLGLIGTPVEHSKSPAMYNYCFNKFGIDSVYVAFDVPLEKAEDAVNALRTFNIVGANVTMPLKNAVIPYLDSISPAARAIGAVNTIVNKDGVLTGHITDGMGYTGDLRRNGIEVAGKKITLLGGGGAASAIAIQCALEGVSELYVFNRRDEFWDRVQAGLDKISAAAPSCKISLCDLADADELRAKIAASDILTNATRVGMAPLDELSNITDLSVFRPDLVVTDVVYNPEKTKMLREAEAAGCRTFGGLGMLLCQGAAAFKLYSGLEMPVDEVWANFYK